MGKLNHHANVHNASVIEPQAEIPRKTYTPIGCLVAIHQFPLDRTPAGLIMPENTRNPYGTPRCLVIAVGPDCKYVKEGDEVLILAGAMVVPVVHDGQTTGAIREENIAGVVIKAPAEPVEQTESK